MLKRAAASPIRSSSPSPSGGAGSPGRAGIPVARAKPSNPAGAIAEGGVRAGAVEPLAKRLGVTKGSFYWRFRDRDELLAAALERWEHERTEALLAGAESLPGPRERLAEWGALRAHRRQDAAGGAARRPAIRSSDRCSSASPSAGSVGWPTCCAKPASPLATARRRARLLYAADLGLFQLALAQPGRPLPERELRALMQALQESALRCRVSDAGA